MREATVNGTPAEPIELFAGVRDIWAFARRRRFLIVGGIVLGVISAVGVHFVLPATNEVRAKILVIKKDANLPAEGAATGRDFEGNVVEDILSTHMEIITSPRIVGRALTSASLMDLPSVLAELKEGEDSVDYVREHLTISRGGDGQAKAAHVINVVFSHPAPEDAARILESVISNYRQFVDETFQNVGSEAISLISQASEDLAEDLNQKQLALLQHREQAPLLWNDAETTNVHQMRIDQYTSELAILRVRKARLEARLQVIEDRLSTSDAGSLSDVNRLTLIAEEDMERLSALTDVERGSSLTESFQATQPARSQIATVKYDRLLTLRMEARALQEDFGPNYPLLRNKRREIEELEKLVERGEHQLDAGQEQPELKGGELLEAYVALLRQDLTEVEQREGRLKELLSREVEDAKEFVRYELQDQALREDVARATELRNTVVDRLKEVNLVRDYSGFVTEVLAPAEPGKPQKAALPLVVVIGALLGCLAGTGIAMLVEATDGSFRSADDIRRVLGLPVLAHFPKVRLRSRRSQRENSESLRVAPAVWSAIRPRSPEAEMFRGLRSELCFGPEDERLKVIQITSPSPGDGKSAIAANLAVSFAQSGQSVLLVDCDLRRPTQHELFRLPAPNVERAPPSLSREAGRLKGERAEHKLDRQEGLSTLLAGESELPDAVQSTVVDGLCVLPCGPQPSNPAELLASSRFAEFLELVSGQYDCVLLDSAPLLSVSDPAVIAARADGVLLVLRLTKDARSLALGAQRKLSAVNARTLGVVVNGLDRGSYRFYGESNRDPVEFGSRRTKRQNDYFVDVQPTAVQAP